jgi:hypothetical protein
MNAMVHRSIFVFAAADAGACFERTVGDRPARDGNPARDVGDWLGGIARGAACGADGGNVDSAAIVRHGRATYDPEARRVRRDAVDDPAGRGSRAAVEGYWGCLARRRSTDTKPLLAARQGLVGRGTRPFAAAFAQRIDERAGVRRRVTAARNRDEQCGHVDQPPHPAIVARQRSADRGAGAILTSRGLRVSSTRCA